jgi:hypothetical protein
VDLHGRQAISAPISVAGSMTKRIGALAETPLQLEIVLIRDAEARYGFGRARTGAVSSRHL